MTLNIVTIVFGAVSAAVATINTTIGTNRGLSSDELLALLCSLFAAALSGFWIFKI